MPRQRDTLAHQDPCQEATQSSVKGTRQERRVCCVCVVCGSMCAGVFRCDVSGKIFTQTACRTKQCTTQNAKGNPTSKTITVPVFHPQRGPAQQSSEEKPPNQRFLTSTTSIAEYTPDSNRGAECIRQSWHDLDIFDLGQVNLTIDFQIAHQSAQAPHFPASYNSEND